MANSASAKKRARQAIKRRAHNMSLRSGMRTAVKKVESLILEGNKETAIAAYKTAVKALDAAVSKGLIHVNKAARKKSRLNKHVKTL